VSILAIDPGSERSAFVAFDGTRVVEHGIVPNADLLAKLYHQPWGVVVFEQIESFGMAVGRDVFETVFWTGRMFEAVHASTPHRLPRRAVKLHLCGTAKAKDANIRAALMDRFGGERAKGTKANPGPLYGVSSHAWAALAVAVTWWDTGRTEDE
jgi:hypothetical protein